MKDFFISYNKADKSWAEWVAWTLEEAGYSVVIQAWDFRPGENFVLKMHDSSADTTQTIAVLSNDYLDAEYTNPEWAAAFAKDPQGKQRILIPIRVQPCNPRGLLEPIIYIDLIGLSERDARNAILEGLKARGKPAQAPSFPSGEERRIERVIKHPVKFPGKPTSGNVPAAEPDIPTNLPAGIPFFTGRDEILKQLEEALRATGATALAQRQAISGLGGIGKTQTALEYARRHRGQYKALLWAVAESKESLISDFVVIARVLNLPEANVQDQTFTVKAVKRWLETNADWLLILDNADDPTIPEEFLPETLTGHVLLTSRAQVFDTLGILNPVELEEMMPADARDFLLKRTGRQDLEKDEAVAVEKLAKELDYLPLALEQAGAYIKELRGSFQDYLASYQQRGLELLEKGHPLGRYRKSIRTTWSLNFQQVEQASKASADLLRVSAFLNPDRIPAELITQGASELGPDLSAALARVSVDPIALDEALQPLIQYSLIHRDREFRTYDIHRLVQAVLKDGMDGATRRRWAELVVEAMARVFPNVDEIDFTEWQRIERLLPHAQSCVGVIQDFGLQTPVAARLMNFMGRYLHDRGRLVESALLYEDAMSIREKVLSPSDPEIADSLHNQAWLFFDRGMYIQAESLFLAALAIRERIGGAPLANSLEMLGLVYSEQGKYRECEVLLNRSLEIREALLGDTHSDISESLFSLANLHFRRGEYSEAESLYVRSVRISEEALGRKHPDIANKLGGLALIRDHQGKLDEAERLYLETLAIQERAWGSNYPRLATNLQNFAYLYIRRRQYIEAEALITRALRIVELELGPTHHKMSDVLKLLGYWNHKQGRHAEAEQSYLRSLQIIEESVGSDHPELGTTLAHLGELYRDERRYSKAEPILRRAITIFRKAFGLENLKLVNPMVLYADVLKGLNRKGESQRLQAQARKIQHKLSKKGSKRR